ncbi:hypothetical protein C8R47DRAFT_136321 [Mycena vitilis]|nr:hypothetical protein C8R47DRAFT_136321 [Mycena vitilis]
MGLALDRTTSSFVASIITSARVLPAVSHALRKRRDRPDSAARLQLRDQPEHNSHIDAYPSGNTAVRRRRPQEQDPHRQSGSTSHREADTKPGNDTIIAESRMADAQGPPDAHSQAVFDQRLTVIWTDVDGESITASLPVEECRTWRDLCDKMGEHLISAQTYTMTHGLAVQTEEGTGTILFEGTWAQWMSSFLESSPVLSLHVVPRTLPDPCFNNASREQDPRFVDRVYEQKT